MVYIKKKNLKKDYDYWNWKLSLKIVSQNGLPKIE